MANRPKVVDLEKKRRSRAGTVWDGERLKLAARDREKEVEQRRQPANKKKLLAAAALVIAVVMLGSFLLSYL